MLIQEFIYLIYNKIKNSITMTKEEFFNLLSEEVKTYKEFLETANNEWIVKGFIDIDKSVYHNKRYKSRI